MRIITKAEFLALPPGTVFAKYEPTGMFGSICIKDESIGETDFYYSDLIEADYEDSNQTLEAWSAAESDPSTDVRMSSDEGGRDGCYDDDQKYCVFSGDEVRGMINALEKTQD